jgi:hypothetical protein
LDIFPGDDVGARKKLAHFLRKRKPLDYDGVRRAVADWQPYAGFVYFHLLLARIKKAGWLCSDRASRGISQDPPTGTDRDWNTVQPQEKARDCHKTFDELYEEEKT